MTVCALCIARTFTSNPKRTRSNFLQWMKSNALKPLIVFNVFLSLSFSPTPVSFSSLFFCTLLFYVAFTSLFSFVCKLKFFNENGEIIFQQKPAPALIFPCCGKAGCDCYCYCRSYYVALPTLYIQWLCVGGVNACSYSLNLLFSFSAI